MNTSLRVWLVRLGLTGWALVTLALAYKVVDYADWMNDQQISAIDDAQNNATLRALVESLAEGRSQRDLLVLIRRAVPNDMVVATDSSIGVGQLTFRFDTTGMLKAISPEYDP